jgi:phosphoserine phosphatase RsbX
MPGEQVSGDQSVAVGIDDGAALFAVLDGLGHGDEAASVATAAADALTNNRAEPIEVLVQLCHRAVGGTRGTAMTLARVDFDRGELTWTGVGNVGANLLAKTPAGIQVRSSARLAAGIVGYRIPEIPPAQVVPIRTGDLVIIASDGIVEEHLDHLDFAAPATTIAEHILTEHAKQSDDAMVLAARHRGTPR